MSELALDHVYPWSGGGYDGPRNWAPICKSCNSSKGSMSPYEYCHKDEINGCLISFGVTMAGFKVDVYSSFEPLRLSISTSAKQFTIVMAFTEWCPACADQKPTLNALSSEYSNAKFCAIRADGLAQREIQILKLNNHIPFYLIVSEVSGKLNVQGLGNNIKNLLEFCSANL
jgi:thiol-disulfide isomerase/thioredoxin